MGDRWRDSIGSNHDHVEPGCALFVIVAIIAYAIYAYVR